MTDVFKRRICARQKREFIKFRETFIEKFSKIKFFDNELIYYPESSVRLEKIQSLINTSDSLFDSTDQQLIRLEVVNFVNDFKLNSDKFWIFFPTYSAINNIKSGKWENVLDMPIFSVDRSNISKLVEFIFDFPFNFFLISTAMMDNFCYVDSIVGNTSKERPDEVYFEVKRGADLNP